MKTTFKLFFSLAILFFLSCSAPKSSDGAQKIASEIASGNYTKAEALIDSLLVGGEMKDSQIQDLLFTKDSIERVKIDFNRTREEIVRQIEQYTGFTPTDSTLQAWEASNALEYRVIDGEKRYFRNAAPNLFRVDASARALIAGSAPVSDTPRDSLLIVAFRDKIPGDIKGKYLLPPQKTKARYTLTVEADVVPQGEIIKAWLPFPRKDVERQTNVNLLDTSRPDYILSGDETEHSSIFMEQKAVRGKPTVFSVDFEFTSRGEWFDLSEIEVKPYKIDDSLFLKYTAERPPHIRFSESIRNLTDSVTLNASTPVETLRSIYRYITATYPWASALEYSTIGNIPEYVIENRKGDCGQVALLLITMLRHKGIPARWQSGWMTHPGEVNLHDWAEVYFEGTGWIPVDVSFGRGSAIAIPPGREFFMSGIDSYRLYLNSGFSGNFIPPKKYPRSETVDFQRGEVETNQWNLYFDKWDYHMEINYQ